ncbi:Cytochrome P450 monooxygenase virE [Trichinella pseudospiralis]
MNVCVGHDGAGFYVRDWHRYHLNKRVDDSRRFSSTQTAGDNRSSNSTANCAVLKLRIKHGRLTTTAKDELPISCTDRFII